MAKRLLVVLVAFILGMSQSLAPQICNGQELELAPTQTAPKKELVVEPASQEEVKAPEKADDVAQEAPKKKRIASEFLLPAATKAWFSVPDPNVLEKQFDATQFGILAQQPAIKPFVESFEDQAKDWIDNQNVRLGMKFDDLHGVHSGEVCIAGVVRDLQNQQNVRGSHGLVMLIDVSETEKEAIELQARINKKQIEQGATLAEIKVNDIAVKRFTLKNQKRFLKNPTNLQAIVNGWFLVSDNELIFRDVLRRLAAPEKVQKTETLASLPAFKRITERTDLNGNEAHIRWFVDPFGYAQLAQALEKEKRVNRPQSDDWVTILKDQGFGAWKGIGGRISILTDEHEILHRTFTHAPRNKAVPNAKVMFDLFDFSGASLEPAYWVPEDCSAHFAMNWQMSKALGSIGRIYDAFIDEGEWERLLHSMKVDPDIPLDVKKIVGLMGNRVSVVSSLRRPIDATSERVVFGIPVKGEPDWVFESIKKATNAEEINLGGNKVLLLENRDEFDEFNDDESPFGDFPEDEEEQEEEQPRFELLATKYVALHRSHLIVTNDKNYMKQLLARKESLLAKAKDYIEVKEAIAKLTDDSKVCWRHFGRLDKTLEANYEMLRRGEMGQSQTVLARIINQIFTAQAAEAATQEGRKLDPQEVRKQKLDGQKLPANYAKSIGPFLGPMGWVMENEKDGWRITGCVLKKKAMTEVVQKVEDKEQR